MSLGRFVVRVIFSCKTQLNQQSALLGFLLSRGLQRSYCKGTVTFGFLDNLFRGNIKLPSADKELHTLSSSVQMRSVNVSQCLLGKVNKTGSVRGSVAPYCLNIAFPNRVKIKGSSLLQSARTQAAQWEFGLGIECHIRH